MTLYLTGAKQKKADPVPEATTWMGSWGNMEKKTNLRIFFKYMAVFTFQFESGIMRIKFLH